MVSALRSLWMMGGSCPCGYSRPLRICLVHDLMTFSSSFLCLFLYCLSVPEVNISVMKFTSWVSSSIHEA